MERDKTATGRSFLSLAMVSLFVGLIGGVLASITYIKPDFLDNFQGLSKLRPIHVSFVMFWIIIGASGGVYMGMSILSKSKPIKWIANLQLSLWIVALLGIGYSYLVGDLGGREYWEFNPIWALPILLAWLLQLINFIHLARTVKKWPVYVWMWMSGTVFFLLIFIENYLWIFPYFRAHFITDMTIQWKVNGSLVGSFNQLIYATAFFMMDRINGTNEHKIGSSKLAFAMYFLGLGNMMFNWSHHIYTLPTESYIRYVGYGVSMTEWIIFLRIVALWKNSLTEFKKNYHFFPYRFIMASDIWVFINVGFACFMSIPAFNIYTHGTHFTVAHSMGTTIGINTMILFAAVFMFFTPKTAHEGKPSIVLRSTFWVIQIALLCLFLSLKTAGLLKGFWQLDDSQVSFYDMMQSLQPLFIVFVTSGTILMIAFFYLLGTIFKYSRINKKLNA